MSCLFLFFKFKFGFNCTIHTLGKVAKIANCKLIKINVNKKINNNK